MKTYSGKTRVESDLIGPMEVPVEALYGVQTLRGVENFPISRFHLYDYPAFVNGLAITKLGAAKANWQLGLLTDEQFKAIAGACEEILAGQHHDQFPVDMIQGGAGTSTNMNANEVIANRALQIMGHEAGEYQYCSPNDHVNCSQSTNDAYPTAIHIGLFTTHQEFLKHFEALIVSFERKAVEFADIVKMGRTQLEDAVPMTLGQTFGAFASILRDEIRNINFAAEEFLTVNMGATAIGTGICSEPGYSDKCIEALREITGWDMKLASDMVAATSDTTCMVGYSQAMRRIAVKMNTICNDLRLLASGPRCGVHEFDLPARQPGSSIMPGKVNPTQCEAITMVATQVMGNDATIGICASQGNFELNVFMPVMIYNFMQSVSLLWSGIYSFRENCVKGVFANEKKMKENLDKSLMLVTALTPHIGYQRGAEIAKLAYKNGITLKEACLKLGYLSEEDFDKYFKPEDMV